MSNETKKYTSPSHRAAVLSRPGEIEKLINKQVQESISEEVLESVKSHIDDSIQIVLEAIENIPEPERPKNYMNFWVGLSIGGSLFLGFLLGILVRGII